MRGASAVPDHVLDVGGKRRVGVDIVPYLARSDAKAHGEAEDVDQFLAGMADEMCAEDAVGGAVDDDLRPGDGLGIGFGGKPLLHVVAVDVDRKTLLLGGGFSQADPGG